MFENVDGTIRVLGSIVLRALHLCTKIELSLIELTYNLFYYIASNDATSTRTGSRCSPPFLLSFCVTFPIYSNDQLNLLEILKFALVFDR